MSSEEIRQDVKLLGLAEKLLLVEDVWDSIALSNSELPLPDWQKRELDKRYREYKAGKQDLHDWKSVHDGLRNEY
ncbi:addiction module protein [candidate division KSB1 bacterium]|nr:addiction module protein [candidate division KSB1 bacterium]MBL7095746.1 addiction module protein [candidate division KSB1 bacterium]